MAKDNVKKRNWAFVAYPESLPKNWLEQLQKTGLQCAISPLHDRDENPDHTPKKPHYHVILCYSGPTAYSVVKKLTEHLHQPVPQPLEQIRGYYRYLTHEDNPEKYQYSKSDIQTINGFDIREFVELTKSEVMRLVRQIIQFIRDNCITEYSDLLNILLDGGESTADMFEVAFNHTIALKAYLTSSWRKTGVARIQSLHELANPEEAARKDNEQTGME